MDQISRVTRSKAQAKAAYAATSGRYDLLADSSPLSWDLSLFRKLDLGAGDFSVDAPINQLSLAFRALLCRAAGAGTVAGWSSTDLLEKRRCVTSPPQQEQRPFSSQEFRPGGWDSNARR